LPFFRLRSQHKSDDETLYRAHVTPRTEGQVTNIFRGLHSGDCCNTYRSTESFLKEANTRVGRGVKILALPLHFLS